MRLESDHLQLQREEIRKGREREYVERLICEGINFATGVPCGVQRYIIEALSSSPKITHIPATRESEAIGIAAGSYLAGKWPIVYMQNSGLFECVNDLTSLLITYKIPAVLSVSWRGAPGEDAPQHFINGATTPSILTAVGIPYFILNYENLGLITKEACFRMKKLKQPVAILIRRGVF